MRSRRRPRRIAVISLHTSPLAQPGTGDAGGMNVYVWQTAIRLAQRGVEVEVFTRATSSVDAPIVDAAPGVRVRNIVAGPFDGLDKNDLPTQLCAFAAAVLRAEAGHEPGHYDLIHSHYWLSGQVGWLARDRWRVPLVHTAHTLGAVKNLSLAQGDTPEPNSRVFGEQQVVDEADGLVANTEIEAAQLIELHHADPARVDVVTPGVDLSCYTPGSRHRARSVLGLDPDETVITFVGRIQPLKAPDVLLRAVAPLILSGTADGRRVRLLVVGGPSGSGMSSPTALVDLAADLGITEAVTFLPPQRPESLIEVYRASNLVAVPSYSESFGLVAIEAQAAGVPVIAADVGGLPVAIADSVTGRLVSGHEIPRWTAELREMISAPDQLELMGQRARAHAAEFSWDRTADRLLASYGRAMSSYHERPGGTRSREGATRMRAWRGIRRTGVGA